MSKTTPSIEDQVTTAWWVGDFTHWVWRSYRDSEHLPVRRLAIKSRGRGVVAHDRVLNISESVKRRRAGK